MSRPRFSTGVIMKAGTLYVTHNTLLFDLANYAELARQAQLFGWSHDDDPDKPQLDEDIRYLMRDIFEFLATNKIDAMARHDEHYCSLIDSSTMTRKEIAASINHALPLSVWDSAISYVHIAANEKGATAAKAATISVRLFDIKQQYVLARERTMRRELRHRLYELEQATERK